MDRPGIDAEPRILGQLLAAQSAFSMLSARHRMSEFVHRAVQGMPGVVSCAVCVPGAGRPLLGGEPVPECADCDVPKGDINHDPNHPCRLSGRVGIQIFPLITQDRNFGFFLLKVEDRERYAPYEPFVGNLANSLAVNIERQWQKDLLEETNVELRRHREHLEDLIQERTAELQLGLKREHYLNAVLRAIRNVNQLITLEKDRNRLIQRGCDLMVKTRGFLCAWILLFDEERKYISAAVAGGKETQAFYKQLKQRNYPPCIDRILAHKDSLAVCSDIVENGLDCLPRNTYSEDRGLISRLEHGGKVYGVVSVYVPSGHALDPEEQGLFRELAGDIAFALYSMEKEEQRKQAEEKRQAIIKTAIDGFWICNLEGKFLEVNESYCKMTGYTREELLEMSIQDVEAEESPEETSRRIKRIVAYGSDRFETQHKRKDSKIVDIEISVNYFNIGEGQMFVFVRDITERKQAQQAQERLSRQLQAKVSELETFSYGIAHDLRSPLVSIEGFSRLLLEDIQNQKEENVQEDIRLLEAGVRKMQQFLNRTLEYSRASYQIKLAKDVSFGKIAKEVITEFNGQIGSIGATVSLADKFPRVYADRIRIAEVLTNLVQNSIKYRDKTVPLKIEIGHYLSGNEIVFFVRDNGLGIDAIEAEKVFALFYRGTSDGEGSGIGLAIVKKIIEAHGGKIWVQQGQTKKGTTMCFTLGRQHGTNKGDNHGKD